MEKVKKIIRILTIGGIIWSICSIAEADPMVNFTLSLNTAKDPGASYSGFKKAGDGVFDTYVIGFQIAINSIDGQALNLSPIAAFCSELEESISTGTHTFQAQAISTLAAGKAGVAGTASSAIPAGGIGIQRAAYVHYLFDQYYISEDLSAWIYTTAEPTTHAFQLALWELTHDSDLSIINTTGEVYVGTQTDAQRNNAIALAQTMLDDVLNANISSSYLSEKFSIWALVNEGDPGLQDVILATKKNLPNDLAIEPLMPPPVIPEPTAITLIALSGGLILVFRRLSFLV